MTDIYEKLRMEPVLNSMGKWTLLGDNTPSQNIRVLMDQCEEYYVDMGELMDRIGERTADMLGVDAVLVTSGTAAARAVG